MQISRLLVSRIDAASRGSRRIHDFTPRGVSRRDGDQSRIARGKRVDASERSMAELAAPGASQSLEITSTRAAVIPLAVALPISDTAGLFRSDQRRWELDRRRY
jgi:hypothetical protein